MEPRDSETKVSVLVVENDETLREVLTTLISRRGYQCESAENGVEAMHKATQSSFDAVVTDIDMPQMDGIALTRSLTRRFPDLPVMIVTGRLDDSYMESAITAGAREFLQKPFEISEFMMRLRRMLYKFTGQQGTRRGKVKSDEKSGD